MTNNSEQAARTLAEQAAFSIVMQAGLYWGNETKAEKLIKNIAGQIDVLTDQLDKSHEVVEKLQQENERLREELTGIKKNYVDHMVVYEALLDMQKELEKSENENERLTTLCRKHYGTAGFIHVSKLFEQIKMLTEALEFYASALDVKNQNLGLTEPGPSLSEFSPLGTCASETLAKLRQGGGG